MIEALTKLFRRPRPTFNQPKVQPLDTSKVSPEDREKLRRWLQDETTVLALSLVEATMPPAAVVRSSNTEYVAQAALVGMAQLEGWRRYRTNLLLVGHTPQEIKHIVEDLYPDQS